MEEKSEFGKGLVICLAKFSEHFVTLQAQIEQYEKMREKHPDGFTESSAVTLWANGATNHLYEIEVPKGREWAKIRKKVKELQEKGLDMGHGSGIMGGKDFTKEDAWALMNLTKEIALLIDRKLGLKPDEGSF